jgi:hypothetical protein
MREASFVFRLVGAALFCLALPAARGLSAEPAKKAPEADPAAERLVSEALEKEAAGDNRARDELLHKALEASPDDPAANWQLGRLRAGRAWRPAADVGDDAQNDKRLIEYRRRRDQSQATVASQTSLAQRVHALSGGVRLDRVETVQDGDIAVSLVVADFNTYFIGDEGILVHDNTHRQPTDAVLPGLAKQAVERKEKENA